MDVERIKSYPFPPIHQSYDWRDSALYALSLGYGEDPLDDGQLSYVVEGAQQAVATQAVVLGYPGPWLADPSVGVNYGKLLHGEQSLTIHRPLDAEASIIVRHRVVGVEDKGEEKGAVLYLEKVVEDALTGEKLAATVASLFLRADGGFGGFGDIPEPLPAVPTEGILTAVKVLPTIRQSALIYRLNGDLNPLHAQPAAAKAAGFERPILHGLCTFGLSCRAILEQFCENESARLQSLAVRFVKPLFPGESVKFEFIESSAGIHFRAIANERNAVILDRGFATINKSA